MTHKQRMFTTIRGELPDFMPYAPRIDLWYNANSLAGSLPARHSDRTLDDICRAEGWALHKVIPEYRKLRNETDTLHSALGVLSLRETVYSYKLSPDVEVKVKRNGNRKSIEYQTPVGLVSSSIVYTEEMEKAGASAVWIDEYLIKKSSDYRVLSYIFENIELRSDYDDFLKWKNEIGEDGIAVTLGMRAASPMHHIQKHFIDATDFYYHYRDYPKEMEALAQSLENLFFQALDIISKSPAEAVLWGINFDDMITYPQYFKKDILPWIQKVSETLDEKGKVVFCHCDGENFGLMDLIRDSKMHVAEGICPFPMTKVKIEEYYQRWSDRLTIFGGIPSNLLLKESTTEEEFESYLDHFFKAVAPGTRLILGLGDTAPANAVFDRLVRIGERIEKEGRLPLEGGSSRPLSKNILEKARATVTPKIVRNSVFKAIQNDVLQGDHIGIKKHAQEMLDNGLLAQDILKNGLISAMEIIGEEFRTGDVFIPEVLLSSRAMNEAILVLGPYLAHEDKEASGKILIATVYGDLHDIGKNMVVTMLRGVGFEVEDMGINIPAKKIAEKVAEYKPDILGLSALLTTTMPEMKKVIDTLSEKGLRGHVKVIVGGAPVNERFAINIGADGYASDAGESVHLVKKMIKF
jgi:methylmalonyl-CoA mutase cobalamin-binding domain/chain